VKKSLELCGEAMENFKDRYCSTIIYKFKSGNADEKILISSIYVKGDYYLNGPNGLILAKVEKIIDYANTNNLPFIIYGDLNMHFELWDDHYDVGGRVETLYERILPMVHGHL
jgi:hypothetical protein